MAHAITETIARPAAQAAGSLRVRADQQSYVEQHSSHQQHSGRTKTPQQIKEEQRAAEIAQAVNPADWPTQRGTPPYRPLNREQDFEHRPYGQAGPERVFVTLMLGGVWVQGVIRSLWHRAGTPGKQYFKYDVGGHF